MSNSININNSQDAFYLANYLRSELHFEEILNLQNKCREKNIDFVVFKGIPLSIDLYDDIHKRVSCDIDCLINVKQYEAFFSLIKTLGYKCAYSDEEDLDLSYISIENQYPHVFPFCRNVNGIDIFLEVHLSITGEFRKCSYQFDFKNDLRILNYKNYQINTLSHNVNMFHLVNHFTKHLINDILGTQRDKCLISHDDKIYEIYNYYKRYKEEISLNEILSKQSQLQTINNIQLLNKMLRQVGIAPFFVDVARNDTMSRSYSYQLTNFLLDYQFNIEPGNYQNIKSEFFKNAKFNDTMCLETNKQYDFNKGPLPSELNAKYSVYFIEQSLKLKIRLSKHNMQYNQLNFIFFVYANSDLKMDAFEFKYFVKEQIISFQRESDYLVYVNDNSTNDNVLLEITIDFLENVKGKIYFNVAITEQTSKMISLRELYLNKSNNWMSFPEYYFIEV